MQVTQRIVNWLQKRGILTDPNSWLARMFVRPSRSGVEVTEHTAMMASAVFRAVTLLGGQIASLPWPTYRRKEPRGKERATEHPVYKLLHDRPNPEMTSFQFRQTGIAHMLLWGNWYAEIEFNRGSPVALWPIPPWRVEVHRSEGGQKYYEVTLPNGQTETLMPWRMFHVPNISLDGLKGMSCISAGREAIGLGMAAEQFGADFFGQGTNIGGIIEYPGRMKDTALKSYKEDMQEKHAGLGKSHRLLFMEEGSKYHKIGIPPNDAQFLETRKFQIAEIGRFFYISQLHKLGDLERATFSNIEEQNIDFVVDTIRPLLVNIEQEANYKLFIGEEQQKQYFCEFVIDGLLRGNTQARWEAYNKGFMVGGFSVNEILELENRNPIGPEGDERFVPMNLVPLSMAKTIVEPAEEPPRDDERQKKEVETRSIRSAQGRSRTAKSYERIFEDAARRVVQREKKNVLSAAKKHLGERSLQTFEEWLQDFYREFPVYIKQQMRGVVTGLAEAITAIAGEEVNSTTEMTPELQKFTEEYMEGFVARYTGSSRGQLRSIINNAPLENLDPLEEVEQRLNEWEERRPRKVALNETVQLSNAITRAVFVGAGITRLRWHAIGAESCPYCQEMNGKVVGIEEPFLPREGGLESDDGRMAINRPTTHPPLHQSCVCQIMPER